MSSFICPKCGKYNIDTPMGYIQWCNCLKGAKLPKSFGKMKPSKQVVEFGKRFESIKRTKEKP